MRRTRAGRGNPLPATRAPARRRQPIARTPLRPGARRAAAPRHRRHPAPAGRFRAEFGRDTAGNNGARPRTNPARCGTLVAQCTSGGARAGRHGDAPHVEGKAFHEHPEHPANQRGLHARVLRHPALAWRRREGTARRPRLHAGVHGHLPPRGGGVHVRAAPVQPAHLRRHEAHGRNRPPHPRQGDRALPGRPRVPPHLLLRPAAGGTRLPAARLRFGAALRARGHLPGRGRVPREVLRVQRRRLVGHEREPRDRRFHRAFRHVPRVRATPPHAGLRPVRRVGGRVPAHLRHLREPGGHAERGHRGLFGERRHRRVQGVRAALRKARRALRRGRRARTFLRRASACATGGAGASTPYGAAASPTT